MDKQEPTQETVVAEEERSFFWMATVDVIYSVDNGLERVRKVNVLTKTLQPFITVNTLGNIQKSGQIQVMEHKLIPRKAKIVGVTINGPWMIGHMTDAEYSNQQPGQVSSGKSADETAN